MAGLWFGRVAAAVIGYWVGGFLGALIFLALWQSFGWWLADNAKMRGRYESVFGEARMTRENAARLARRQEIFFNAIFSLLGYLAKADGVVCGREIDFATILMNQMKLDETRRRHAQELFRRGKEADFDIDTMLRLVRLECAGSIEMFMRILVGAAAVSEGINEVERRILQYVATRLGVSAAELEQIEAAVRGARQSRAAAGQNELHEAYKILGVSMDASDNEIKKAYRKLMSRHHPDKMAAKGMPPEMMRVATERAQDITRAYDTIKQSRNL